MLLGTRTQLVSGVSSQPSRAKPQGQCGYPQADITGHHAVLLPPALDPPPT